MRAPGIVATCAVVACAGCTDAGSSAADAGAGCGPGLQAIGTACAPIFDRCAVDEVPLLGGGCKRVGVRECDGGIAGPPDWTCKRIGVEECDGGIRGPPDWTCKAIGPPTKCLAGWERVKRGWCEPLLPDKTCPTGTMEVLGKQTCQPVGECGTGTWGKIKLTPYTVFVDASYAGGDSDGTKAKPYTTIGAAMLASSSPHVAVAAGTYKEDLVVTGTGTTIVGVCPKEVTVEGQTSALPAIMVSAGSVRLSGLTVTGKGTGVWVGSSSAKLDGLVVRGCDDVGVVVYVNGSATITDTLITDNAPMGIQAYSGAEAVIERCVMSDTKPDASTGENGFGLFAFQAKVSIKESLVSDNTYSGVRLAGSEASIEGSVVRRTRQAQVGPTIPSGQGVATGAAVGGATGKLTMKRCVVAENAFGVELGSTEALVENTVIRDTGPGTTGNPAGYAVWASPFFGSDYPSSKLTLRRCLISDSTTTANAGAAVMVGSSSATIDRCLIQRTKPTSKLTTGSGFGISAGWMVTSNRLPSLTVTDSVVSGSTMAGVMLQSAAASLSRTVLRDTLALPTSQKGGQGLGATISPGQKKLTNVSLKDCLVARNVEAGVSLGAAKATVERTVVRDNRPRPYDGMLGYGFNVGADATENVPSTLTLKDCLVAGNTQAGVVINSSDATIERTVVRDTHVAPKQGTAGVGLAVGMQIIAYKPSVTVRDALFARNRHNSVQVEGARLTMERTVVRDTLPVAVNGRYGTGVNAVYRKTEEEAASLSISDSVVASSRVSGLELRGSEAVVKRSAIRDTRPQASNGRYGSGILVLNMGAAPSKLALQECRISASGNFGIHVARGASAEVSRSEVRQTRGASGLLGDGIAVEDKGSRLVLADSLVDESLRVGLLVAHGRGTARRSVFRRGKFPVYLPHGAPFLVAEDNVFLDNAENSVSRGKDYKPSALPDKAPSFFK